jgi:hypothetical protein
VKKIILNIDDANNVHTKSGTYIGMITEASDIEDCPDNLGAPDVVELIRLGVIPEDLIKLKNHNLI